MLEQLYHDQLQNPLGPENKARTSKRRKTDPVINTPMILDPDDDDDNYLSPPSQGKKSRLGVGYAGDQKEDVSGHPRVSMLSSFWPPSDYRTSGSPGESGCQG